MFFCFLFFFFGGVFVFGSFLFNWYFISVESCVVLVGWFALDVFFCIFVGQFEVFLSFEMFLELLVFCLEKHSS